MKQLLIILLLTIPGSVFSQYTFTISEIRSATANDLDDNSVKVNIKDADFSEKAKISITGITSDADKTDAQKISLKTKDGTVKNSEGLKGSSMDFTFSQDELKQNKEYQLFYGDVLVGRLLFDVSETADTPPEKTPDAPTSYIGALVNANTVGNNKFLKNFTPQVNLGTIVNFKKSESFRWDFDVNPYLGSEIDTKDSVSFIPALMLPGRAGLSLNNYLTWGKEDSKLKLTFMLFGFGLKWIPDLKDSATTIVQHNIRTGIALKYQDVFLIGVQYTHGFHNSSSESKRFFKNVFTKGSTDIDYLTVSGQFSVKGKTDDINNYIFLEWRGLLSTNSYSAFTNNALWTLGVRKDLSLSTVFASSTRASSSNTGKNIRKPALPSKPLF